MLVRPTLLLRRPLHGEARRDTREASCVEATPRPRSHRPHDFQAPSDFLQRQPAHRARSRTRRSSASPTWSSLTTRVGQQPERQTSTSWPGAMVDPRARRGLERLEDMGTDRARWVRVPVYRPLATHQRSTRATPPT